MSTDKNIPWINEYLALTKPAPEAFALSKYLSRSILITGASVTGKTTLFRCLVAYFNLIPMPVHTTRTLRGDEVLNVDAVFISVEEFKERFLKGTYIQDSLESMYFSGAYYGCPKEWIHSTEQGLTNCFVCPTVVTARKIKEILKDKIFWVHMTANNIIRQERLLRRNPEMTKEDFEARIKRGDVQVDITGNDLVIDTSYLSANDIFLKAMRQL